MKKFVASVSLVAVGASGLQAAVLPAMTAESGKPWTLSATLRGFYDDNVNGYSNSNTNSPRDSFGFEFSPALEFSFPMEQTALSFGTVFSIKEYENKPANNDVNYDWTLDLHAALTHRFSDRYQLSVTDSFVIGQEPDFLRAGNTFNTFQRISGSNERNYGKIIFSAQITPELGAEVGYENTYYSYADNHYSKNTTVVPPVVSASHAGLLDELDNLVHLDLRYQLQPQTIGVVGYQFRLTDYIGNQPIAYDPVRRQDIVSNERNALMNYLYVGLEHNFRPDLTGAFRVGGYYTDYYNNPNDQNAVSPYAQLSLRYTYLPESSLEFGFNYDYSAASSVNVNANTGSFTLNTQSATVYAALNHRIRPKLYGNIIAQYQNSMYYGGLYDGKGENYYLVGLNLQYRFTPNFSTEVGYNYDLVTSDVTEYQGYDRNRIYIGVRGSY